MRRPPVRREVLLRRGLSSARWRPTSTACDDVVFQEDPRHHEREGRPHRGACAKRLAAAARLAAADAADAERAAYLCQGRPRDGRRRGVHQRPGRHGHLLRRCLAARTPQVARAIADHYRPRFSGDAPPASRRGARIVAMADKLDTVCGLFASGPGLPPAPRTPSRCAAAAIGIVAILFEAGRPVSLAAAIDAALGSATPNAGHRRTTGTAVRAAVADFFVTRTKVMLRDERLRPRRRGRRAGRGRGGAQAQLVRPRCAPSRPRAPDDARRVRRPGHGLRPRQQPGRAASLGAAGGRRGAGRRRRARRWPAAAGEADGARAARRLRLRRLRRRPSRPSPPCARPSTRFFEDVLVMDEDRGRLRERPPAPPQRASSPRFRPRGRLRQAMAQRTEVAGSMAPFARISSCSENLRARCPPSTLISDSVGLTAQAVARAAAAQFGVTNPRHRGAAQGSHRLRRDHARFIEEHGALHRETHGRRAHPRVLHARRCEHLCAASLAELRRFAPRTGGGRRPHDRGHRRHSPA